MKERIKHIIVIICIAVFTLGSIACVEIKLGNYLRTANLADVYYYCSSWEPGTVIKDLDNVPEDVKPEYIKRWEEWRLNDRPLDGKAVRVLLLSVDIVFLGVGVLAYLIFLCLNNRAIYKAALVFGLLCIFVVVSGIVIKGLYSHYKHNKNNTATYSSDLAAPIIYLYDDQSREVSVKLDIKGDLTHSYPSYNDGWTVKTSPDGTLTDKNGRKYEYLFWEAKAELPIDLRSGFCVKGEDTADFLEKALSDLGLSDTEANTFIMYWLPQMEDNPYNVISFQTITYEDTVVLDVDPVPDTVIRVNMAYYGTSGYVEMQPQDLTKMNPSLQERKGLTLVEWGGEEV